MKGFNPFESVKKDIYFTLILFFEQDFGHHDIVVSKSVFAINLHGSEISIFNVLDEGVSIVELYLKLGLLIAHVIMFAFIDLIKMIYIIFINELLCESPKERFCQQTRQDLYACCELSLKCVDKA